MLEVFLRRLGVPAEDMPVGEDERSGMLRGLLASRRVLMLLDNAATEAQVRPLLPGAGGSLVLVTSRSVLEGLEADQRISLDVLPGDEATALLAGLIGTQRAQADPQALSRVLDWCGGLPLALRIAGQILAVHPAWPVARLERMLVSERDRLRQLAAGDLQVRAPFAASYRQLHEEDARMFRLLGLHPGSYFDAGTASALARTSAPEAARIIGRLAEACLVTEDGEGRFRMHELLRLFASGLCEDTDSQEAQDAAETNLIMYYVDATTYLSVCLNPLLLPSADREAVRSGGWLPAPGEALAFFQAERPGLLAALGLAARRGHHELVARLSGNTTDALVVLHHFDDLITVWETALTAARHAGKTDRESRALNNLGIAYERLGRSEDAIGCYQQSLAICRETGDRHGEGAALGNLGIACHRLRRLEEAIGCFEQSLAICREIRDRHGEGMALGNLSNSCLTLGRLEEAISYSEQSLAICRETGDWHGEGAALRNLGIACHRLRRLEEAIGCFEQAVAICRETGDRHGEGAALGDLGYTYNQLRQPERAAACWQDAATAARDAGEHDEAVHLEQLAAGTRAKRRLWRKRSD